MRRTNDFQSIPSEGGLLPPDLLRRVIDPREKLPGTLPEDYGLPKGERLNEVITQSWNRMRKHWAEFQNLLGANSEWRIANSGKRLLSGSLDHSPLTIRHSPGAEGALTGLTNEKWTLPLLRELGFGLLPTSAGPEINGRTYAINRFLGPVPVHLVGCGLSLDRRAAGVRGAAAANPHGLVQEFLNRSAGSQWGIVSNGLRLRILRDNQALSRQSFLDFDLETMFGGELYSDFVLLWLVAHATRFAPRDSGRPETCWLEEWTKLAEEQGTRALGELRGGVEKALQILGEGFTSHPKNTALRDALRTGQLQLSDFHGQLLRVVYRLIFLFVAEDRTIDGIPLLHPRDEEANGEWGMANREGRAQKKEDPFATRHSLFAKYYGTARLRELAGRIKGSRHGDLWRQFQILVGALSGEPALASTREHLALPALGSFLWSLASTAALNDAELINHDFLEALRHLGFARQDKVLRPVDYKNLGAEELGGVYESLLALSPQISADGARFTFAEFAGSERKMSGSYYTPDSLVQCLLDSALDPVVEERLEEAKRMASGEWRMVTEPYRKEFVHYAGQRLSRVGGLAAGQSNRQGHISSDQGFSEGRGLRDDIPDSSSSSLYPSQHSGRLGETLSSRIHSVSAQGERQPNGTGDAPDCERGRGLVSGSGDSTSAPATEHPGQATPGLRTQPPTETELKTLWEKTPFSIRYSLLAENALLTMRVVDPACGSGHFLVGAAHRLARHLARVRAQAQGESEPSPLAHQQALRDVIGHCLYGVDVNPMAAELCRVSLWLEALEPGKPLSFLDHHIRVGNSLLGTTPELIAGGLPDEAFNPIEGDDKKVCSALKKRNKREREGQMDMLHLMVAESQAEYNSIESRIRGLDETPDDTIDAVKSKADQFNRLVVSPQYRHAQQLADAWCAAFVWKKEAKLPLDAITTDTIKRLEQDPDALSDAQRKEVERLAAQYLFFHWHLAFPEVFAKGGFDCVLGNPPWERVKLQEKEWFAERSPEIANAPNAAARKRLIEALKTSDPHLYNQFLEDSRQAEGESHLLRHSGRYPLCGRGDINVYTVFAEGMRTLLNDRGRVGCVLPSGIATDDTTKFFFQDVVEKKSLASLYDFENKGIFFPGVHSSYKFCLFTAGRGLRPTAGSAEFVFFAHAVEDLRDPERRFTLSAEDIALLNPNTRTCPIFRSRRDAGLTKAIYRRVPVLLLEANKTGNPWEVMIRRVIDMGNDKLASYTKTRDVLELEGIAKQVNLNITLQNGEVYVPMFEGKMFSFYNHRDAGVIYNPANRQRGAQGVQSSTDQLLNPFFSPEPLYWYPLSHLESFEVYRSTPRWLLGYKNISSPTNERSMIASILPFCASNFSIRIAFLGNLTRPVACCLVANMNCFPYDYAVRQSLGGINLSDYIIQQVSTIPPSTYAHSCFWSCSSSQSLRDWLLPRVLELSYTAWDLEPFAQDSGWSGPPFRWDEKRCFLLRCELDAAFFHLYLPATADGQWKPGRVAEGAVRDETSEELAEFKRHFPTPRDAVSYIMDTFPIVRRKDEEKYTGDYRTKRVILEIYDEMAEAMRTGIPYKTRLAPPPGPPTDERGNFLPLPEWKPGQPKPKDWPSHIHAPKGCEL